MTEAVNEISDEAVGALIDLSRSANVFFELINDRVTVRAVNPSWGMWRPVSRLLDEIGQPRIAVYLRNASREAEAPSGYWPRPKDAMVRWASAMGYR
jgi:hypothetical protein